MERVECFPPRDSTERERVGTSLVSSRAVFVSPCALLSQQAASSSALDGADAARRPPARCAVFALEEVDRLAAKTARRFSLLRRFPALGGEKPSRRLTHGESASLAPRQSTRAEGER